MRTLRLPEELVGEVATLTDRLMLSGRARGMPDDQVVRMVGTLVPGLLESPCFFDRLTRTWRYDFGIPIELLSVNQLAVGAHMFTPVDELLDTLLWADRRLPKAKQAGYVHRLALESRHQDALVETSVVRVLPDDLPIEFEVPAEAGKGSIDWRISPKGAVPLLFDVKNRISDLVQQLEAIATVSRGQPVPRPRHDPSLLFRSVVSKFQRHEPSECLHGVWVFTRVKQEESELQNAFAELDPTHVHFAVVSNRSRECYFMTQRGVDRERIRSLLQLRESPDRITFSDRA